MKSRLFCIMQVAETSHLSYVGSNYDPDSPAVQAAANCRYICAVYVYSLQCITRDVICLYIACVCSYCIGALDRKTGVMTLHRAQHFLLKPHVPGNLNLVIVLGTGSSIQATCG